MVRPIHWGMLVFTALTFYLVLFQAWHSLIRDKWDHSGSYSHGFIILALFVFLFVRAFRLMDFNQVKPTYWVLPFQLLASLLFILSVHANIQIIQWFLLPVLILMFFTIVLGVREVRRLLFPVLFLYFAIPVWDYLKVYLQSMAVFVNTHLLEMLNIPAYIQEFYVTIPEGTFEVAAGCSGLGVFLMIFSLSSLYAYLNYSVWRTRIILVVIAIIMGLLINWIRIFVIIYMGHVTNMQTSLITEGHATFGWLLFAGMLVPFFAIAYYLPLWLHDQDLDDQNINDSEFQFKLIPYVIAVVSTFTLPMIIHPASSNELPDFQSLIIGDVLVKKPWVNPDFGGADFDIDKVVLFNENEIQLSVRSYGIQNQGENELISHGNSIYPASWVPVKSWVWEGYKYEILDNQQNYILLAYQYSVGDKKTNSRTWAKLYELLKPVMSKQRSSLILLSMVCAESECDNEGNNLKAYIKKSLE